MRQLPRAISGFTNRHAELATLDRLLVETRSPDTRIATISGGAGMGKTALALHWAHRARDRFPAGLCSAAAALFGLDEGRTRRRLGALAHLNLLGEPSPDRFQLHDLLRVYAGELVEAVKPPAERAAALERLRARGEPAP